MPLNTLLRCHDLVATADYYRDILGFRVTESAQSTLTVHLEDCCLIFTAENIWNRPVAFSGTLYCAITDVEAYYRSVSDKATIAWPLQDMPYGSKEFGVQDCNGYYLAFTRIAAQRPDAG